MDQDVLISQDAPRCIPEPIFLSRRRPKSRMYSPVQDLSALIAISSSNGVIIGLKNSCTRCWRLYLWQRAVSTNLRVNQAILGTSNENKTLYLEKVGKFRWIEFPYTDSVALFLGLSQKLPYSRNQREVRG